MPDISEIKLYARKNDVPIMQDQSQQFICEYIKNHNYKKILEIGTAIGYSTIQFAKTSPDVKVTSIELDIDRFIKARQNVEDCNLQDRITLINENALDTQLDDKFDLIFIDGPKAQYIKFFEKYKNNLNPNGVIISDNLFFNGMVEDLTLNHNYSTIKLVKKIRKYIDFLKNNQEFTTEFFELGDGISVSSPKKSIEIISSNT